MIKRIPLWLTIYGVIGGVLVILPFLAPVFMAIGWYGAGRVIYFIYSFMCHQLPERSYFLFGSKFTYSLPVIQSVWQNTNNPMLLRQFVGNADMGWKVAWSDRMISMYTATWIFGLAWWPLRRRLKPLPLWGLLLFLLPMAIDGGTHFLSDLSGIGQGLRDTNAWLAAPTFHSLPASFYAGDAWGSLNSIMRLLTGVLFGLGIVWFCFPYLNEAFTPAPLPQVQFSPSSPYNPTPISDPKHQS